MIDPDPTGSHFLSGLCNPDPPIEGIDGLSWPAMASNSFLRHRHHAVSIVVRLYNLSESRSIRLYKGSQVPGFPLQRDSGLGTATEWAFKTVFAFAKATLNL